MESGEALREKLRKAGLTDSDIDSRMEEKRREYKDLLSEEGILTIIATEAGVLASPASTIAELSDGQEATLEARVSGVTAVREFTRADGSRGHVATVFLADDSGEIPLTLWDEECRLRDTLRRGDTVKIVGGTVRSGQRGLQVYLGRGRMFVTPAESRPPSSRPPARRIRLSEVAEAKGVAVRGTIAKLYPLRVYEACPDCFRSVAGKSADYYCAHCAKKVIARHVIIAEVGLDDCTGYIRATFFDRRAERLLGTETREAHFALREIEKRVGDKKEAGLRYMYEHHHSILGQEIIAEGEIITSEYSGFVLRAYDFANADAAQEAHALLEGFT